MTPTFRYERRLWRKGYKVVAGADEVGRGAWAGPIVAGAVAFEQKVSKVGKVPKVSKASDTFDTSGTFDTFVKIDDSKKLTAGQREKAAKWIKKNALCWGIGQASVLEINKYGVGRASKMAFRRAVANCNRNLAFSIWNLGKEKKKASPKIQNSRFKIQYLLIDAFYLPYTAGLPIGRKRVTGTHPVKDVKGTRQLAIINGDEKCFSIAAASIIAKVYRDRLVQRLSQRHPRYKWAKNKGYGTKEHQEAIQKHSLTRLHRKQFVSRIA